MRIHPTMAQRIAAMKRSATYQVRPGSHFLDPLPKLVLITEKTSPEEIGRKARALAAPLPKKRA